jgi:hypothetical protein
MRERVAVTWEVVLAAAAEAEDGAAAVVRGRVNTEAENITVAGIMGTAIEGTITTIITTTPRIITTGPSMGGVADGGMELRTRPLPAWRWVR